MFVVDADWKIPRDLVSWWRTALASQIKYRLLKSASHGSDNINERPSLTKYCFFKEILNNHLPRQT